MSAPRVASEEAQWFRYRSGSGTRTRLCWHIEGGCPGIWVPDADDHSRRAVRQRRRLQQQTVDRRSTPPPDDQEVICLLCQRGGAERARWRRVLENLNHVAPVGISLTAAKDATVEWKGFLQMAKDLVHDTKRDLPRYSPEARRFLVHNYINPIQQVLAEVEKCLSGEHTT
jgi:hypothetical protein